MENLSLKNFSLLGIALVGVSAITTAMIPSKSKSNANYRDRLPNNGIAVQSTIGGVVSPNASQTVIFQALGSRSYTRTGAAGNQVDNLSATSVDVFAHTNTQDVSWATGGETTAVANENINPPA